MQSPDNSGSHSQNVRQGNSIALSPTSPGQSLDSNQHMQNVVHSIPQHQNLQPSQMIAAQPELQQMMQTSHMNQGVNMVAHSQPLQQIQNEQNLTMKSMEQPIQLAVPQQSRMHRPIQHVLTDTVYMMSKPDQTHQMKNCHCTCPVHVENQSIQQTSENQYYQQPQTIPIQIPIQNITETPQVNDSCLSQYQNYQRRVTPNQYIQQPLVQQILPHMAQIPVVQNIQSQFQPLQQIVQPQNMAPKQVSYVVSGVSTKRAEIETPITPIQVQEPQYENQQTIRQPSTPAYNQPIQYQTHETTILTPENFQAKILATKQNLTHISNTSFDVTAWKNMHSLNESAASARYPSECVEENTVTDKIEQALDLVKGQLLYAVREEVETMLDKITELSEKINKLQIENNILRANTSPETLTMLLKNNEAERDLNKG